MVLANPENDGLSLFIWHFIMIFCVISDTGGGADPPPGLKQLFLPNVESNLGS
jgi:hypothetical protein